MLGEGWECYATKKKPSEKDRAQNTVYSVDDLGTVTISLAAGTITLHTDLQEEDVKKFMKKHLGKQDYELFCNKIHCSEVGAHWTKSHGTARYFLEVFEPRCNEPNHVST